MFSLEFQLSLLAPSTPVNVSASCGDVKGITIISWNEPVLTYGLTVNYTVEYWRSESPTRKLPIHTGRGKSTKISIEIERLYIFQVHSAVTQKHVLRSDILLNWYKY